MNTAATKKFLVNGEWRSGKGETFDSINPANGDVAGVVYAATAQDVDDAGRLLLRTADGPVPVGAGDVVHVRPVH